MKKNESIDVNENKGIAANAITGPVTIINQNGLTEGELRSMIEPLVEQKISEYKLEAQNIARQREEFLTARLVDILLSNSARWEQDDLKRVLSDPSMQLDFNKAYEGYIKYGGEELLTNLAELLDQRMKHPDRSLLQITLSEAIRICPLLGKQHFAFLALVFLTTKAKFANIQQKKALFSVLGTALVSLYEACKTLSEGDIAHLVYVGCGVKSVIDGGGICERIRRAYSEALLLPQTYDSFPKDASGLAIYEKVPGCFRRYEERIGIVPCTKEEIKEEAVREKASQDTITALLAEYDREIIKGDALRADLSKAFVHWEEFEEFYKKNGVSSFELTSVGIVLGGICAKRLADVNSDLSIWINDTILV